MLEQRNLLGTQARNDADDIVAEFCFCFGIRDRPVCSAYCRRSTVHLPEHAKDAVAVGKFIKEEKLLQLPSPTQMGASWLQSFLTMSEPEICHPGW